MFAVLLNVLVIIGLGLGLFYSYKRGLKGSLVHFAIILTSAIIAIFITSPITHAILGINVGTSSTGEIITLNEYLYSFIIQNGSVASNPLVTSITSAILGPIVFLVLLILLYAIFEVAYILISKFWLKKAMAMKEPKSLKKYGLIVGAVECLLITLLAFMPLTTLTTTVQELSISSDTTTESDSSISSILNNNLPPMLSEFVDYYNASPVGVLTNWGTLNEPIFSTVSPIYAGDTKLSLKEDLVPLAKDYDKVVNSINDENEIDYSVLHEVADNILDSKVFTALENELIKITNNKEEFVSSLNLDIALTNTVTDVLTNFENKFKEKDFNFKEYIGNNIDIALNELENNIDLQNISSFIEGIVTNNINLVFNNENISAACLLLESVVKLPIIEELFPIAILGMNQLPAFVTDIVDIYYLDTYENTLSEVPYLTNVVRALSSVTDVESNQTLLQILISSDTTFMQKFLNSSVAESVIQNMASSKSLNNLVINVFERMDNSLYNSLQNIDGNFNKNELSSTIGFDDSEAIIREFMTKVSLQANDIVTLANVLVDKTVNFESGEFLNTLKEYIIKNFNFQTQKSDSVFATLFENITNYFNGTVLKADDMPVFTKFEEFNSLIDNNFEQVPEEDKIYGELSKYLCVDYMEIFNALNIY